MIDRLEEAIKKLSSEAVELSKQIHAHPETAFEEHFACKLLSETISKHGFNVEHSVGGLKTAFKAQHIHSKSGPVVAFLAEYDALPEIGHACGHNLIAGASWLAAAALGCIKKDLPGTLLLIGTPAEEGGSGKGILISAGVFKNVDVAMMFHPSSRNLVGESSLALREVTFKFYGKEAHASACPEAGINALDGVIATFNLIAALRQHIPKDCKIHGIITHGGTRPNIVPGFAAAQFYVRAPTDEELTSLFEKVLNCAKGAALGCGAKLEIEYGHSAKDMRPDPKLSELFRKNMKKLGIEIDEHTGKMGSTDMGDVSHVCRAIHPYLAICPKGTLLESHTREFAQASNSELGYQTMIKAAHLLALTGLDVFLGE